MTFSRYTSFLQNTFYDEPLHLKAATVFFVSELTIEPSCEYARHTQTCDEITYAVSGSAKILSGDVWESLSAGQIHYLKKSLAHRIVADPNEKFRFVTIGFTPNTSSEIVKLFYDEIKGLPYFLIRDIGDIRSLSRLLVRELYLWDEHSEHAFNRYITQIFLILYRLLQKKASSASSQTNDFLSTDETIYRILQFINREYIQLKTVKEIATALTYSENYISHLFKEKLGITLKEYLTKKKLTYAVELMCTSEMNLEEISEYLNFSSSHTFRRVFKQHYSMTPSQYIEAHSRATHSSGTARE